MEGSVLAPCQIPKNRMVNDDLGFEINPEFPNAGKLARAPDRRQTSAKENLHGGQAWRETVIWSPARQRRPGVVLVDVHVEGDVLSGGRLRVSRCSCACAHGPVSVRALVRACTCPPALVRALACALGAPAGQTRTSPHTCTRARACLRGCVSPMMSLDALRVHVCAGEACKRARAHARRMTSRQWAITGRCSCKLDGRRARRRPMKYARAHTRCPSRRCGRRGECPRPHDIGW